MPCSQHSGLLKYQLDFLFPPIFQVVPIEKYFIEHLEKNIGYVNNSKRNVLYCIYTVIPFYQKRHCIMEFKK